LAGGPAGNVIAYNFGTGFFQLSGGLQNLALPDLEMHNPHPWFNLAEGNVGPQFMPDGVHGSSSHNTFYRNWAKGTQEICTPNNETRGPVSCAGANGHLAFQALRAIVIDYKSNDSNIVGNVIGSSELTSLGVPLTAQLIAPSNRPYTGVGSGLNFGYCNAGD